MERHLIPPPPAVLHRGRLSRVAERLQSALFVSLGLSIVFAFFFGPLILIVVMNPKSRVPPPASDLTTMCVLLSSGKALERCVR